MIIMSCFAIFIVYTQVLNTVMNIKSDLYYITQNGIIANNKEELALNNYLTDNTTLKSTIENILKRNYVKNEGSVKSIIVKNAQIYTNEEEIFIHTLGRYKKPIIHIEIEIAFIPLIKLPNLNSIYKINIHEDVKISLLEYEEN